MMMVPEGYGKMGSLMSVSNPNSRNSSFIHLNSHSRNASRNNSVASNVSGHSRFSQASSPAVLVLNSPGVSVTNSPSSQQQQLHDHRRSRKSRPRPGSISSAAFAALQGASGKAHQQHNKVGRSSTVISAGSTVSHKRRHAPINRVVTEGMQRGTISKRVSIASQLSWAPTATLRLIVQQEKHEHMRKKRSHSRSNSNSRRNSTSHSFSHTDDESRKKKEKKKLVQSQAFFSSGKTKNEYEEVRKSLVALSKEAKVTASTESAPSSPKLSFTSSKLNYSISKSKGASSITSFNSDMIRKYNGGDGNGDGNDAGDDEDYGAIPGAIRSESNGGKTGENGGNGNSNRDDDGDSGKKDGGHHANTSAKYMTQPPRPSISKDGVIRARPKQLEEFEMKYEFMYRWREIANKLTRGNEMIIERDDLEEVLEKIGFPESLVRNLMDFVGYGLTEEEFVKEFVEDIMTGDYPIQFLERIEEHYELPLYDRHPQLALYTKMYELKKNLCPCFDSWF